MLFSIVSTGKDLDQVYFGKNSVTGHGGKLPKIFVDCSTISVEESAAIRDKLKQRGADFVAAPVSGNAKVIKAGKLSAVLSGPEAACKTVTPMMEVIAPQGVSYVGEGELARICKIAHNVMLGVVIENLIEITLLANKMGVPRHAFLAFINNGVMGSMFTRYKSPALVNLDWTTTFTPELLRKDLDLGLELGREYDVPMPVTAATREVLQTHFGAATLQKNPEEYLQKDFAALMETMALAAGMKLDEREQERADRTGELSRLSSPGLTAQSNRCRMEAGTNPREDGALCRKEQTAHPGRARNADGRVSAALLAADRRRRANSTTIRSRRSASWAKTSCSTRTWAAATAARPALSASARRPVLRLRRGDRHPLQLSRLADGRGRPLHRAALRRHRQSRTRAPRSAAAPRPIR